MGPPRRKLLVVVAPDTICSAGLLRQHGLSGTVTFRTGTLRIIALSQLQLSENFTALAAELSPVLLNYLKRYVGNPSLAEDLLQETLIRMDKGLPGFEQRSSHKTWAFAIASRVAIDYFRKPENSLEIVDVVEAGDVPDETSDIGERLIVAEMGSCVRQVIDSLPPDYRTALVLHDLEGMSAEQVGIVCDCSVATAKIRIHRARARLKQKLEQQCDFQRDGDGVFRCDHKA